MARFARLHRAHCFTSHVGELAVCKPLVFGVRVSAEATGRMKGYYIWAHRFPF
jgi:hypothetical protein